MAYLPNHIYDCKGNNIGYNDTKIYKMDEVPDITVADQENYVQDEYKIKNQDPKDEYYTTDLDIEKDYQKDDK